MAMMAGNREDAIEFYRLGLETEPDSLNLNVSKGLAHMFGGEFEAAEACLRHAVTVSRGEFTFAVSVLANTLIRAGRAKEAREFMDDLDALAERRYVSFYHRLAPWIDLGRFDKWGPMLDRAVEERDPTLVWIRLIPKSDRWLEDPRLAGPLRRAGLVD